MSNPGGEPTQEQYLEMLRQDCPDREYWGQVKSYWIGLGRKGVARDQRSWLDAFRKPRAERTALMNENEHAALARLPAILYRGVADLSHALGMSWTDNLNIAALFAWRSLNSRGSGFVLQATVPKECVMAYFLEHESEVVIDPSGIKVEELPMPPEEMERRATEAIRQGRKESALDWEREQDED